MSDANRPTFDPDHRVILADASQVPELIEWFGRFNIDLLELEVPYPGRAVLGVDDHNGRVYDVTINAILDLWVSERSGRGECTATAPPGSDHAPHAPGRAAVRP